MRSSVVGLVCLSCVGPTGDPVDASSTTSDAPESDADTDTDGDGDSATDTGAASEVAGKWAGLCVPSDTGTTPDTIQDLALGFELRESGGAVEGNGSLTLYSYESPDTSDSGGSPSGTETEGGAMVVTGTWAAGALSLTFGQPYYNEVYELPMAFTATIDGAAMSGTLVLYPDGDPVYPTASWPCTLNRS